MIKMIKYEYKEEPVYENEDGTGDLIDFEPIEKPKPEEVEFEADEYDIEDDKFDSDLVAKALRGFEPSSSSFHKDVWYENIETNYHDENQIKTSYHFDKSVPVDVQREVWDALHGKKKEKRANYDQDTQNDKILKNLGKIIVDFASELRKYNKRNEPKEITDVLSRIEKSVDDIDQDLLKAEDYIDNL